MTLSQLKTALETISNGAFQNKVAYRFFPADGAPQLPFICIMETQTENFKADSKVYLKRQNVYIELYSAQKDQTSEAAIEAMLDTNQLIWDKAEEYIPSEEMLEVVYEVIL